MRRLVSKLSYANVMSTIAVILAVGGGATAIAMSLPKNSVKSKQIAKEAVKNGDIAKDAVTGDKVKESTLAKVPLAVRADTAANADNAAHATNADNAGHASSADTATSVGSIPASSIAKEQTVSSGLFTGGLTVSVSGYGSFSLRCEAGDKLAYEYAASPIGGALETGLLSAQEAPLDPPEIFTFSGLIEGASSLFGTSDYILHVHWEATVIGTNKTILIEGGGYDASGTGCAGQLHAYTTS